MSVCWPHRRRKKIPQSRSAFLRFCWVIWVLATLTETSEQCAVVLRFPTLTSDLVVNAPEHSTVAIPFVIDTAHCPKDKAQPVYIYVSQESRQGPKTEDFCVLRVKQDGCFSFNNESCPCRKGRAEAGEARFIKMVSIADNGVWVWRSSDGRAKTEVTVNVQGTGTNSGVEDKGIKVDPELKLSTIDSDTQPHLLPPTTHRVPPGVMNLSPPTANEGSRETGQNKVFKDQPTASKETEKLEDEDKKRSGDNNDDDKPADSFMATGVMVGLVNVITIVVVVVVVFVLVRRHSRKSAKRHPRDSIPPLPNDARLPGQRPETPGDVTHKYNTIVSVTSSHYEVLPLPDDSLVVDNDGYLEPTAPAKDEIKDEDVYIC